LPEPIALCVEFPGTSADESGVQRAVAAALGIARVALPFEDVLEPDRTLVETLEAASWLPLPPPLWWFSTYLDLVRIGVARGCNTAISGDGSEWFSHGEGAFAADLLRNMDLGGLYNLYVAERQYSGRSRRRVLRRLLWDGSTRVLLRHLAACSLVAISGEDRLTELLVRRQLERIPSWAAPDPGLRRRLAERWAASSPRPGPGSFEQRQRIAWLDSPDLFTAMDFFHPRSRHVGIEWREGFHDVDLVEFLFSVPAEFFVSGGRFKSLARASIRRRYPQLDLGPLRMVYFGEVETGDRMRRALDVVGGLPVLINLGAVDPRPIRRFAAGETVSQGPSNHQLWEAVAMEAWLQARV
jgi:hypothetical protein